MWLVRRLVVIVGGGIWMTPGDSGTLSKVIRAKKNI
jgi:hypothetical protein